MLIHHKILVDGSFTHEVFTRDSWMAALKDGSIARHWGHPPEDCYDPVAKHLADLRVQGFTLSTRQHDLADVVDPLWSGPRTPAPRVQVTTIEPTVWPPETPLTPWMLCQLTTMCLSDAKDVLSPRRKHSEPEEKRPNLDRHGQYTLF